MDLWYVPDEFDDIDDEAVPLTFSEEPWPEYCGGVVLCDFCGGESQSGKEIVRKLVAAVDVRYSVGVAADTVEGCLAEAFKYVDKYKTMTMRSKRYYLSVTPPMHNPNSGNMCRVITIYKTGGK